jgi:hypothetical protein
MTTPPLTQWSKLPSSTNPTSRTIFWLNTLDDEILRNVYNATTPRGQLSTYFSPPPAEFDATGVEIPIDRMANILKDVPIPALPPPNASPPVLARYGHALQHYRILKENFNTQQAAMNYIKDQLIQCIDPCTMAIVLLPRSFISTCNFCPRYLQFPQKLFQQTDARTYRANLYRSENLVYLFQYQLV